MAKKEIQEEAQKVAVVETTKKTTKKSAKSTEADKEQKEETVQKPKRELSLKERDPETFLKEFNWDNYQEGIDPIESVTLKEFEKLSNRELC
jgi:hypothetical protein